MPRAEEAAPLVAVTPEVKQFLDGAGIGTYGYGETLMAWGYDRLHFLSDMPPDELSQLIAAMKMKRPHERKFRGALQGLGGGGGGDPTHRGGGGPPPRGPGGGAGRVVGGGGLGGATPSAPPTRGGAQGGPPPPPPPP
eukprot:COSAG01_NODE_10398_length_2176_cov_5.910448_2_plen_137_part_01